MATLTVTAKGQVTLRRDLMQHLGVSPGDRISLEKLPDGRIELRSARPASQIAAAFDLLKRPGAPTLSIDDIAEIAAEGWAGRR